MSTIEVLKLIIWDKQKKSSNSFEMEGVFFTGVQQPINDNTSNKKCLESRFWIVDFKPKVKS